MRTGPSKFSCELVDRHGAYQKKSYSSCLLLTSACQYDGQCQGSGTGGAGHTAGDEGKPDDGREYIGLIYDRGYNTLAN